MRNIVKQKPGNGCQADTPLKAFDLFFDDAMTTEIVTWTNQIIENVKSSYKRNAGFVYQTCDRNLSNRKHHALYKIIKW